MHGAFNRFNIQWTNSRIRWGCSILIKNFKIFGFYWCVARCAKILRHVKTCAKWNCQLFIWDILSQHYLTTTALVGVRNFRLLPIIFDLKDTRTLPIELPTRCSLFIYYAIAVESFSSSATSVELGELIRLRASQNFYMSAAKSPNSACKHFAEHPKCVPFKLFSG